MLCIQPFPFSIFTFAISRFPFHLCRFTLTMKSVIYLSIVTASISFTVTETKVFHPVREWTKSKNGFLGELVSCGYCFGHWVAFVLVAIYRPKLFEVYHRGQFFIFDNYYEQKGFCIENGWVLANTHWLLSVLFLKRDITGRHELKNINGPSPT